MLFSGGTLDTFLMRIDNILKYLPYWGSVLFIRKLWHSQNKNCTLSFFSSLFTFLFGQSFPKTRLSLNTWKSMAKKRHSRTDRSSERKNEKVRRHIRNKVNIERFDQSTIDFSATEITFFRLQMQSFDARMMGKSTFLQMRIRGVLIS